MVWHSRVHEQRTGQFELHVHPRRAPTGALICPPASARGPDACFGTRCFSTGFRLADCGCANCRRSNSVSSAACGHLHIGGARAGPAAGRGARFV